MFNEEYKYIYMLFFLLLSSDILNTTEKKQNSNSHYSKDILLSLHNSTCKNILTLKWLDNIHVKLCFFCIHRLTLFVIMLQNMLMCT